MSRRIELTTRESFPPGRIDVSAWRLEDWLEESADSIAKVGVAIVGEHAGRIGDFFRVTTCEISKQTPEWIFCGDCRHLYGLGHEHRLGSLIVDGDAGDYCGSCMLSGSIEIRENAGDFLAAPTGSRGVGMRGGRLSVRGDVGRAAGFRMRGGTLSIGGDAGPQLAGLMVAGTITCDGSIGRDWATGMRRGTLVLAHEPPPQSAMAFTPSRRLASPFLSVWSGGRFGSVMMRRGDRRVGGIGEIWTPEQAAVA